MNTARKKNPLSFKGLVNRSARWIATKTDGLEWEDEERQSNMNSTFSATSKVRVFRKARYFTDSKALEAFLEAASILGQLHFRHGNNSSGPFSSNPSELVKSLLARPVGERRSLSFDVLPPEHDDHGSLQFNLKQKDREGPALTELTWQKKGQHLDEATKQLLKYTSPLPRSKKNRNYPIVESIDPKEEAISRFNDLATRKASLYGAIWGGGLSLVITVISRLIGEQPAP